MMLLDNTIYAEALDGQGRNKNSFAFTVALGLQGLVFDGILLVICIIRAFSRVHQIAILMLISYFFDEICCLLHIGACVLI